MRSITIAALAAITFLTSMLVGYAPANAVAWAGYVDDCSTNGLRAG